MPFRVSQWPYSPDPRTAQFDNPGWDYGQVPPWAWVIDTSDATGLAAVFNDGVLVKPTTVLPGQVTFENVDVLPDDVTVEMKHTTFQEPVGPPPLATVFITVIIRQLGLPEFSGVIGLLYPTAIAVQGPVPMQKVGAGVGTMPNGTETTPAIWNAE